MIPQHGFWWILTMMCVIWYSTITVYVAVRGAIDIKDMLKRLGDASQDLPDRGGPGESCGRGDESDLPPDDGRK